MENVKEKIKTDSYRNWVKSTIGLEQTNRAVYEYVKEKFRLYTHGNAQGLNPNVLFTQQELSHISLGVGCSIRQNLCKCVEIKYVNKIPTYKWKKSKADNCIECETSFQKLLSLHNTQSGSILHWENSNDTTKITLEWAIAKMFMPQGNNNNDGPQDTDPYAMFHIMEMYLLFRNPIRATKLKKLKAARNNLFHSSDNAVSDVDVKKYFKRMIGLLEEVSNDIYVDQSIRDVIVEDKEKLEKDGEITLSLFDDALKVKRKGIYYDFEKSLCENNPETLKELLGLAEQTVEDIQEIKKHAHEVKYIEKYKSVMTYCRKENKQLSNELNELKKGIQIIPVLHDEMETLREQVGKWRRALRFDISQLEVDGIIIVVIVTIVMSLLLRVCVYFA